MEDKNLSAERGLLHGEATILDAQGTPRCKISISGEITLEKFLQLTQGDPDGTDPRDRSADQDC